MESRPLIVLRNVALDQPPRCYAPLCAPLQINIHYTVTRPVPKPFWAATFKADVAYKCLSVPVLEPTECVVTCGDAQSPNHHHHTVDGNKTTTETEARRETLLKPGEIYQLDMNLGMTELSRVEEKYMLQVGVLRLVLLSENESLDGVNFVVQVKRHEDGELMRLIMDPLK